MTAPVLLDVTSLASMPQRSGIQRVQRETIRHWPEPDRLVLVTLDPQGGLRWLPDGVRAILCPPEGAPRHSFAEDARALASLIATAPELPAGLSRHILNMELFYEPWRATAYQAMCRDGWRVQWLVYDFLPWLHPELFPPGTSSACMHYLQALRDVPELAFISDQTRSEFVGRVMRGRRADAGPVLPLGADGLGLERQQWSPARCDIVLLGTLERRKNIHLVAEAFRLLWSRGHAARLVLAGRLDPSLRGLLESFLIEGAPFVSLLEHASDEEIRQVLRGARAVMSASAVEGFGLPSYEALQCGIPAIAAASLPSMRMLPPRGHVRLEEVTAATLAAAVERMLQDEAAALLWREAAGLELPTWQGFAQDLADWVLSDQGCADPAD